MYEVGTIIWVVIIIALIVGLVLLIGAIRRLMRKRRNLRALPPETDVGAVGQRALAKERALLTNELIDATKTLPQHELELVHSALWMAMLLETSADGSIDHREIGFVADVFGQITGRRMDIQFVVDAAEDIQRKPQSALQEISKAREASPESRHYVLTGAFLVSLMDRSLDSGETDCLGDIADTLDVSAEARRQLYAQIMKRLEAASNRNGGPQKQPAPR